MNFQLVIRASVFEICQTSYFSIRIKDSRLFMSDTVETSALNALGKPDDLGVVCLRQDRI